MRTYEKVRRYIDSRGLEHSEVAKDAEIPVRTFDAIMCGQRTMYAHDLKAICKALNVNVGDFITDPEA